jgi:hypothetical protein
MRSFFQVGLVSCLPFLLAPLSTESAFAGAGLCRDCPCVGPECVKKKGNEPTGNKAQDPPRTGGGDQSSCGPNPPDKGFIYYTGNGKMRSGPSASSDAVAEPMPGSRLRYDRITNSAGERWFHINNAGLHEGWVPSSDVSCTRPPAPDPPRPRIVDCGIREPRPTSSSGGARGFGSEECQQDPTQSEPVSLR